MTSSVSFPGAGALRETGKLFALGLDVTRSAFRGRSRCASSSSSSGSSPASRSCRPRWSSIPFGAVIALQLGSLTLQIGAQSFTGAASVLAVVQQASPIVTALLIAGAGGSAICADLGARTIREEIDAMEVLGVSPIQRLVVPRVLAAMLVAVLLNGMVSRRRRRSAATSSTSSLQGGTPGAYLASFSALAQLPDLWVGEIKALIFGFIAGVVAAYRGLQPRGRARRASATR